MGEFLSVENVVFRGWIEGVCEGEFFFGREGVFGKEAGVWRGSIGFLSLECLGDLCFRGFYLYD